ncbi:PAS domain S-box protein [Catenuloplanes atrovinosus]|uniref:histidine kinase n=1 Tax=Catenuloplanes atrovinosus TaxID=137266 RepID=A0AAE3YTF3_9ACTN|nr:PAS domain S-box protein [Catenuloplanes atrovinosus]MDR7278320.1 PAS domain S-box-containing protein [Catenuloplanes atrovinosus]
MPDQIFLLANVAITVAYAAIAVAIAVPVGRAGQLRTNKLAVATAMIFFSCSVGHGLHAVMATRAVLGLPGAHAGHVADLGWTWSSAAWDTLTALIGLYYWTLRRGYGVLLGRGAIYVDPGGQRNLAEAAGREQRAREQAAQQRAWLTAVVEHSDDAIIGLTPEGVITAWNRGAERTFGYPAEEVLGRPARMLADGDGNAQQDDVLARIRAGEDRVRYETQRVRKDGTPIDVALNVAPIRDSGGTVIGVSVVARDMTAAREDEDRRRALQERTNQAQRMESLGRLAGGVAHDFNNILAIITNYTEFAIEQTADRPAAHDDLVQVRAAAGRATALTRQLLTFTRGDTVQPRDVDLNDAIEEVRAMLDRTIGEDITLLAVPAEQPPIVHLDPGQLHQVLLNLAINARDAMPGGGTLVLEAGLVTLDGDEFDMQPPLPAGTYARLLVSDTGEGMPPHVAEHIFEPFFTTKQRGKGTGLGLATVYGIVTEAGGSLNVYTEPGIGTTFRIYLPTVTAPTVHDPAREAAPPRGAGRTVLVVEDETALARVIVRILSGHGYRALAAAGGAEALEILAGHDCDLLLTDVIMPEMSGTRLADLVHRTHPGLPVVFMSGYSNGLLGSTHVIDGDIVLLEKPFTGAELLRKVGTALAGRRRSEPRSTVDLE